MQLPNERWINAVSKLDKAEKGKHLPGLLSFAIKPYQSPVRKCSTVSVLFSGYYPLPSLYCSYFREGLILLPDKECPRLEFLQKTQYMAPLRINGKVNKLIIE